MGSVVAVVVIDQQIGLVAVVVVAAAVVVEVVALAAVDFEGPKSAVAKDLAIDWPVHHLVAAVAAAVGFDRAVVVAVEAAVLVASAAFVAVR